MYRAIVVAAACGAVSGFRVDHRNKAKLEEKETKAERHFCSMHGDPHLLTFDSQWKAGPRFDPMHAPGHWWLVKSELGKIEIQAEYGPCGMKNGGGWMAARLNGVPRTCITGIAVGGGFLNGHTLIIQPPCEWDWENSKCSNSDTKPRITFMGKRIENLDIDGLSVKVNGRQITANLPEQVTLEFTTTGSFNGPDSYLDGRIWMNQGSAGGEQCGHCGNFDGNAGNDAMYHQTGLLKEEFKAAGGNAKIQEDDFCDANVHCKDRFIPGDKACEENKEGGTFDLNDCPKDVRDRVEKLCRDAFDAKVDPMIAAKMPQEISEEELEDCIKDGCLDEGFIKDDAEDAADEDKAFLKAGIE